MTIRIPVRRAMAAVLLSALWLPACASVRVNSYAAPTLDVRAYRTYAWDGAELGFTGDPRLDNNEFFQRRVQQAVEAQMGFRGYEKATSGPPDLTLHVHARVEQRIDSSQIDRDAGPCREDCRAFVFDQGTLLVDLLDARTRSIVWRGWAERSLDGVIDDQAIMNQTIDRTVSTIFARLPARRLGVNRLVRN